MTYRGTTNRNARGSSRDRFVRRVWLVDVFGDGMFVACVYCWTTLTVETVSPDRIVPGCKSGTYARGNIRPSCVLCQSRSGGRLGTQRKKERRFSNMTNNEGGSR